MSTNGRTLYNAGKKILTGDTTKKILNEAKNTAIDNGIKIMKDTLEGKSKISDVFSGTKSTAKKIFKDGLETGKRKILDELEKEDKKRKKADLFAS